MSLQAENRFDVDESASMESSRPLINPATVIEFEPKQSCPGCTSVIKKFGRGIGATISVSCLLVSWVASAELVQNLQTDFDKPFFICVGTRLTWISCLFFWFVWRTWYYSTQHRDMAMRVEGAFTWSYFIKVAIFLAIVAFMSAWTWYVSLADTPVTGNTAVWQTTPVVVFLISIPVINEEITLGKVVSTILCVSGALVVSFTRAGHTHHTNSTHNHSSQFEYRIPYSLSSSYQSGYSSGSEGFGYAVCGLSILLYAIFEVLYKKMACSDRDTFPVANSVRFLGLSGFAIILLFPFFPILHYTKTETFEWPSMNVIRMILMNAAFDTVFNMSLLVTIMLTSPLFTSLASILTIPVSVAADYILGKPMLPLVSYAGIGLIAVGFLILAFTNHGEPKPKKRGDGLSGTINPLSDNDM